MQRSKKVFAGICFVILASLGLILKGSGPGQPASGTWAATGSMAGVRSSASAALLADGRILLSGGVDASSGGSGAVATAEVYSAGSFAPASAMSTARTGHTSTTLTDGRVLVAGGKDASGAILNTAEIYNPAGNSWSPVSGAMTDPRAGHTATRLADGRVLLAGGEKTGGISQSADIFDPATGTFTFAGNLSMPREGAAAAALPDGRVLIVGGFIALAPTPTPTATADFYSPGSGFTSGPAMNIARGGLSATTLLTGKVLLAGGSNGSADLASAETFDPAANSFSPAGSLSSARSGHLAFLLPNNNSVLFVSGDSATNSAELYAPSWTGTGGNFAATGSLGTARANAAGSTFSAGTGLALVAGGDGLSSGEVYGFATVKTDKADYAPGTPVTITGSGWTPGETVTFQFYEYAGPYTDMHPSTTSVVDANGDVINTGFAPDSHDVGVTFILTASGATSGSQAQASFTDALSVGKISTVGAQTPSPVSAGNSATYSVTVSFNGGGTCDAVLSTSGLPAGATGSFAPVPSGNPANTITSTGADVTTTLTVSTTAGTTPVNLAGSAFTITATHGGNCNGSASTGTGGNAADPLLKVSAPLTVTINQAAAQADPTKNSPINFTVVFSASVSDFATGDVTLSGTAGATTGTVTGSGTTYNVAVSGMTNDGTVIASIGAGVAHDSGGGPNLASTSTDDTVTYDTSAPVITVSFTAPDGTNGWHKATPVTGTVSATDSSNVSAINCTDTLSGLTQGGLTGGGTTTASRTLSVTGEGTHDISCTATDGVGNAGAGAGSTTMPVVVKIDTTAPTISASAKTADNNTYTANTWTNQNVTVTFTCSDSGSGLAAGSPPAPTTVSTEGSNLSASGTCTDDAGNSASTTFDHIQIDKTPPTSSASPSPAANGAGWNNSDVTVTLSATDNAGGSGVESITYSASGAQTIVSTTVNASSTPVTINTEGTTTISFHATDVATNVESPDKTSTIKLDKTLPTSALTFPANGTIANAGSWNSGCGSTGICGTASDPGAGASGVQKVEVSIQQASSGKYWTGTGANFTNAGETFLAATGTTTWTLTFPASDFPADGTYIVHARATDTASNVQSPVTAATFTYDTTPPVVTVTFPAPVHGLAGWYNAQDTVPVVGTVSATDSSNVTAISCTDTAGGLTQGALTGAGTGTASRSLSIAGDSTHNISCTATDGAGTGNTGAGSGSTAMPVVIKIDTTPPPVTAAADRAPDHGTWYNHALTVSFSETDATSGAGSCDAAVNYSGPDNAAASVSGHCTDVAGNQGTGTLNFKFDSTPPTITFSNRTAPNGNGWNNTDVTLTWSCADITSGPVSASVSQTVTTEGNNQSSTGTCDDNAGNMASNTQTGINIDKTAPTLSFGAQSPAANVNGWNNTNVSFPFTPADSLSGVDTTNPAASPLLLTMEGSAVTGTVTVTDKAGNTATFTSPAVKIDKTAPTLSFGAQSPAANVNGWNNTNVSFPFTPADSLSGVDTTNPAASPLLLTMEGSAVTGTVTVTDKAGNTATFTSPAVKIDKTLPTIAFSTRTAPNGNGWNNTDVILTWSCTDALSGPVSASVSQTVSTEGNNQSSTGTCTDLAGNSASDTQTGINIDKTAPTISGGRAPSANANGWNNVNVTASFTCMDSLSGLAAGSPPAPTTVSTEGLGQSVNGTCFDLAGNSASTTVNNINIDKTLPTASASASPSPNGNGWNNTNVTVSFTGNDSLSGIDFCATPVTLSSEGAGQSASGTCTDKAGNVSATATASGINIDKTAPTLSFGTPTPAPNGAGWNNTNVSIPYTPADSLSGVNTSLTPPSPLLLTMEGSAVTGTVTVTDKAGNTATFTSPAVKIDKTAPAVSIVTHPTNPTSSTSPTFTFMEMDATSGVGSVTCQLDGGAITYCPSNTQSYSGLHDGSHTFVVGVMDNAGNSSSASYLWIVDTTPPVVSNVTLGSYAVPMGSNTSVTLTANVSDVTTGNSNILSAEYSVDGGLTWLGMTISPANSPNPSVAATANLTGLFSAAKVWNICVRGTDAVGNTSSATAQCAILAVYDASGGFVTGGGWIISPVKAGYPYMAVSGKANFGFVSQYKKGQTLPTGNTQFQFQEGGLDFESNAYQWLVVSGSKAQFQGTGTINGTGNYGFQVFAYDGSVKGAASSMDGFRIQIGTLLPDGSLTNIVYDNSFTGGSSPGSGTEPLDKTNGNGSIQIHGN